MFATLHQNTAVGLWYAEVERPFEITEMVRWFKQRGDLIAELDRRWPGIKICAN